MPIIRRLFGPFHRLIEYEGKQLEEVRWHFFGIRDDYRMGHWTLIYYPFSRTWKASSNSINDTLRGTSKQALIDQKIVTLAPKTVVHYKAHLVNDRAYSGTISSILKSKLPAADVAFATSRTILQR